MGNNSQLENLLLPDIWYAVLIFLIIVFSGLLGGLAAYFLSESEEKSIRKSFVLGLVASFIVPVFLNMISSNLLSDAQRQIDKVFIFAGFCVLASVFSKNFLENIYNRVLQLVSDMKEKVERMEEASSEPDAPTGEPSKESLDQKRIDKTEFELLNILSSSRWAYRSISGLKNENKLDRNLVDDAINKLLSKKLIETRIFKNNQTRYFISTKGRKLLGDLSTQKNNNT